MGIPCRAPPHPSKRARGRCGPSSLPHLFRTDYVVVNLDQLEKLFDQGATVTVERGQLPVRLARLAPRPFTDTLVAKFELPVVGWRGNRR